MPVDFMMTC